MNDQISEPTVPKIKKKLQLKSKAFPVMLEENLQDKTSQNIPSNIKINTQKEDEEDQQNIQNQDSAWSNIKKVVKNDKISLLNKNIQQQQEISLTDNNNSLYQQIKTENTNNITININIDQQDIQQQQIKGFNTENNQSISRPRLLSFDTRKKSVSIDISQFIDESNLNNLQNNILQTDQQEKIDLQSQEQMITVDFKKQVNLIDEDSKQHLLNPSLFDKISLYSSDSDEYDELPQLQLDKKQSSSLSFDENQTILKGYPKWDKVNNIAFSKDGQFFAIGSKKNQILIYSSQTHQLVRIISGHREFISAIIFTNTSDKIISAGSCDQILIQKYKQENTDNIQFQAHQCQINSISISNNDKLLLSSAWDAQIKVWDLETLNLVKTLNHHKDGVTYIRFTDSNNQFISSSQDCTIKIWNTNSLKCTHQIKKVHNLFPLINTQIFSTSQDLLAIAGPGQKITIYQLKIDEKDSMEVFKEISVHEYGVSSVQLTNSANQIISSDIKGNIKITNIYDTTDLQLIQPHTKQIYSLSVHPDQSKLVSASVDQTICIQKLLLN